jgi:hypothetical protein
MAAVKACGQGALLSGFAAGYLFGLVKGSAPPPEVSAPTERRVKGVGTHRGRNMDARDATRWRGIPVTTVPRTLVDLSSLLSLDELARAAHEAAVRHRTTPAQVEQVLARMPRAKGAANLRRVVRGEVHVTLSNLETCFLGLLRRHGLPLPTTNRPAGTHRVDCRWPDHSLTVELDSYATATPATPGKKTANANVKPTLAATTTAATRTRTCSSNQRSCSPSYTPCSRRADASTTARPAAPRSRRVPPPRRSPPRRGSADRREYPSHGRRRGPCRA